MSVAVAVAAKAAADDTVINEANRQSLDVPRQHQRRGIVGLRPLLLATRTQVQYVNVMDIQSEPN